MKNILIILVAVVVIGAGVFFLLQRSNSLVVDNEDNEIEDTTPVVTESSDTEETEREETREDTYKPETVIGTSGDERDIVAYHFGTGEKELLFVGGIHGGYSWNTALVGFELIDYLNENPSEVPSNVKVTVIPVLNPDGLTAVVGTDGRFTVADAPATVAAGIPGRFNSNDVDLNRNFDCEWQETGTWQNRTVSGGSAPFSEPESQAIRDYVLNNNIAAAVVYYSAAGGVFASNCKNGVLPETTEIMNVYAEAAGYTAHREFNFYEITGDMVNWLAREGIPGISVLLTTHRDVEWEKNKVGIEALLAYYAE